MNKTDVLNELEKAKQAHMQWVTKAQALIDGKPLDKEEVPVDHHICDFGQWYDTDGQKLNRLSFFKEIDALHENMHDTYHHIFDILFAEKKADIWHSLFGSSSKIKDEDIEKAKKMHHKLVDQSKKLIHKIEQLEAVIKALTEEGFNQLVN